MSGGFAAQVTHKKNDLRQITPTCAVSKSNRSPN